MIGSDPRIARLKATLESRSALEVHDVDARRAAVAIILRTDPAAEPELLFIQRAEYPGDPWSGQVAFPGGREEPLDDSPVGTAIREAREETGIELTGSAELLGVLNDLHPQTASLPAIVVRPFVFAVAGSCEAVSSPEVASAFWVPLSSILDRSVWRDTDVSAGGTTMSRIAFHHQGYVVWGLTERILSDLVSAMG